jgi:hypothetical protein
MSAQARYIKLKYYYFIYSQFIKGRSEIPEYGVHNKY